VVRKKFATFDKSSEAEAVQKCGVVFFQKTPYFEQPTRQVYRSCRPARPRVFGGLARPQLARATRAPMGMPSLPARCNFEVKAGRLRQPEKIAAREGACLREHGAFERASLSRINFRCILKQGLLRNSPYLAEANQNRAAQ